MEIDILKASDSLSRLDLKINTEYMDIEILWFRVMEKKGEWNISRHRHSSHEFHFVASGGCKVLLDDSEFDVNTGEFYLTAPGVYHTQMNNERDDYLEYSLNCDIKVNGESISEEKQLLDILNYSQCKPYKDINHLLRLFESALEEAYSKNFGFYNKIKSIVQMLLIESTRAITTTMDYPYQLHTQYKKKDYRFIQIERYILDNINNTITTKDIAEYMHLSDKQVCRIVQQNKEMSTKEFMCKLKFLKSKELLKNTKYSIGQISEKLGFSSQYYFNQFFKTREGCSPSLFRKKIHNV
ncbi:AraC family transcriptional regulator [Sporosalibacterium faouarense]|uniref:AraC family transcriptional regulator n=1 Tax=Sporosalibacterium faouarense TaxID=516123 RepID=UPI00192B5673|nr:AraC family transcriptional regulator [Sporosalibacterium faouarense]